MINGKLGNLDVGDKYRPIIMKVINISPESFYKSSIKKIEEIPEVISKDIKHAQLIDIGAASTAPPEYGTPRITRKEEKERIKQFLDAISDNIGVEISVDTMHSEVAEIALKKGIRIINDVSGLKKDQNMAKIIADYDASVIIMANKESPGDIGKIDEIKNELKKSIQIAINAGISEKKIIIDPGIGFGKPVSHDIGIIRNLESFRTLNKPILVGISRKSFIGKILGGKSPEERLYGSLSATAIAVYKGAHIIRTHDVLETKEIIDVAFAIKPKLIENDNAILLSWINNLNDAEEIMNRIGAHQEGIKIMKQKIRVNPILLKNVQSPAATIIKEELLSLGGDAVVHMETVDCHVKYSDVLILATDLQIKGLIQKVSKMTFFGLPEISNTLKEIMDLRADYL